MDAGGGVLSMVWMDRDWRWLEEDASRGGIGHVPDSSVGDGGMAGGRSKMAV